MASKASAKPRVESIREWCALDKREKYVTRGEFLVWMDRLLPEAMEQYDRQRRERTWYMRLFRWLTTVRDANDKDQP